MGPGCVHLGLENIDHVGAIGVPGYRWSCKIVGEDGAEVAPGEVGELCVKGPGVMECYYKDPEATAETLVDGWLHTGDMARQDADGFYWLVDRKKDVVIMAARTSTPWRSRTSSWGTRRSRTWPSSVCPTSAWERSRPRSSSSRRAPRSPRTTSRRSARGCRATSGRGRSSLRPCRETPTGKIEKPALRAKYGADALVARETRR